MFTADEQLTFIRSDGEEFLLNMPPTRAVMNMTGWGKPVETMHSISGPFQHGNTVVSYRLNPRTISLDLYHRECSRDEWHTGRSRLVNQMGLNNASSNSPVSGVLKWEYFIDSVLITRCLDVFLTKGLGFTPLSGWQKNAVLESLEFTAPNPVIYDPTERTSTVSSFTLGLVFPATFPVVLGSYGGSATIVYTGTWETTPQIAITGPAAGVYIANATTGKEIRFDYSISGLETVTFTLTQNNVSVVNNYGDDLISYVLDESDLNEFNLQPSSIVAGGSNVINVYVGGAAVPTTVVLTYLNRFYGI